MIVYANSLEQISKPILERLPKLRESSGKILWDNTKGKSFSHYLGGSQIIEKNGEIIDEYISEGSKAKSLIEQSKINGTIEKIFSNPNTLAITAGIYETRNFSSDLYYKVRIVDIGTISEIINAKPLTNNSFSCKTITNQLIFQNNSNQNAYSRREFELWFYWNPNQQNQKINQTHEIISNLFK
jgi:hypothetical protein